MENEFQVNELPIAVESVVAYEVEVEDKEDERRDDDDNTRWSYFVVAVIDHEFVSKMEAKKWLQENGVNENKIIRGKILPVSEKVKRIITLG
jgi:hypothetical protein